MILLLMLSTNDCAMPLLKIATLLDTSSTTTVNFIREVSQAQHVYFITSTRSLLCGVARVTLPRTDGYLTVEQMKKEEAEKKM